VVAPPPSLPSLGSAAFAAVSAGGGAAGVAVAALSVSDCEWGPSLLLPQEAINMLSEIVSNNNFATFI